ncbi:MAG: hypothetical protein GY777_27115 [Candidatus Brocadiaceae bacterium]|nr:hypothetical protein [Candidatus Brocadiaceae bacterium]
MNPKVLVTGFEPFDIYNVNSSWEGVKAAYMRNNNLNIECLPVSYLEACKKIEERLEKVKPEILLMCGLSKYNELKLEKVARKPKELSSFQGKTILNGIWPWNETVDLLTRKNISIDYSYNAGEYVCESTYWYALNFKSINCFPKLVTFLHVPVLSNIWNKDYIAEAILSIVDTAKSKINEQNKIT